MISFPAYLLVAVFLCIALMQPAQAESGGRLIPKFSGKCLDVTNWSGSNGANVQQWGCSGGDNQMWTLRETNDGYVAVVNVNSGKCLDVNGWSTANGGNVQQWECTGNANQNWSFRYAGDGYWKLVNQNSGKCLDVSGPSPNNGVNIHQWDCYGGSNQQFQYRNYGGYTDTRYPIVLVHGFSGFSKLGGIYNYFFTIPYQLERSHATVRVASLSAFNSSEQRGQQLLGEIENWGFPRVNLIAHSQGAPTARYAAAMRPDLIASVTSVDGVNKGSRVADVVRGVVPPGSHFEHSVADLVNGLGKIINLLTGQQHSQDSLASLVALTKAGTQNFNNRYPQGVNTSSYCAGGGNSDVWSSDPWGNWHDVRYYSWTGTSQYTNGLDVADPALALTGSVFDLPNDGLVDKCSAALGKVIRDDYDMNHLDAVNQIFGLRGWTDPVALFRQQANRLKNAGL